MAHRGETFEKNVSCIADLKTLGSKKLPKMVRGRFSVKQVWSIPTDLSDSLDYYNEGAMDLITYASSLANNPSNTTDGVDCATTKLPMTDTESDRGF